MSFNAAQWRSEIIEAIDDCNHRCLSWEEQHARVEKLLSKLASEQRAEGTADGLASTVKACRSVAEQLAKDARTAADNGDDVMMVVSSAMRRAYETMADINERAERAVRGALANVAASKEAP